MPNSTAADRRRPRRALLAGAVAAAVAAGSALGAGAPAWAASSRTTKTTTVKTTTVKTTAAKTTTVKAATTTTTGSDWTLGSRASVADVAKSIRADVAYKQGITGKGVGVALIDTGVAPVTGLTSGNIVNGPDLSIESQVPALIHKDSFGHGTHMAGIIAGRDNTSGTGFRGIAPDAKLTSIKVGNANGAVDITQVMAALDWVVQHRNDDPANPIKVINLSYGTDSSQLASTSPLALAVENAWKAGIVVVIASGNTGKDITMPAVDATPIVVGSVDMNGTTNPADDTGSTFSASIGRFVSGQGIKLNMAVDVLAPGKSILSLRTPGSYADTLYPSARDGERYFTGSGTSQSAAVISGAVALIMQKFPKATPAQVRLLMWGKMGLMGLISGGKPVSLDLSWAMAQSMLPFSFDVQMSSGTGSLQAARGTSSLTFGPDNVPLTGENDLFGPFSTTAWAAASKAQKAWVGGSWMGNAWTGDGWGAATDGQQNWNGRSWSGRSWSGRAWSDNGWSGRSWSGRSWSAADFSGRSWSGVAWSGAMWS